MAYATNTTPLWSQTRTVVVDDEALRRIVREEIAKLPLRYDVPDFLPEDG